MSKTDKVVELRNMDKGYNLYETGWASKYLVKNGSKAEAINAIVNLEAELEQRENCIIMDFNFVLVTPDGTEYHDNQILKWLKESSGAVLN